MLLNHTLITESEQRRDTVFHHLRTRRNDRSFVPRGLPMATNAIPGTPEKIAILKARLEAGVILHHPDDGVNVGCIFP